MTNGVGNTALSLSPLRGGQEAGDGMGTGQVWSLTPSPQEQAGESVGRKWTGGTASLGLCPYQFTALPGDFSALTLHSAFESKDFLEKLKGKPIYLLL